MSRSKSAYHKGQHVLCRFDGTGNGDLIVGVVESVRGGGTIILTNLLTSERSVKEEAVLTSRNKVVHKAAALRVMALAERLRKLNKSTDDIRRECRLEAVQIAREPDVTSGELRAVRAAIAKIKSLPMADRRLVYRELWEDALEAFGVQ